MAHAIELPPVPSLPLVTGLRTGSLPAGLIALMVVLAISMAGILPFTTLDLALIGAILALTPAAMQLAGPGDARAGHALYRALSRWHPIAAACALVAMILPAGALAGWLSVAWLLFTAGLALFGLMRFLGRDDRLQAAELLADAGLAYAVVGGAAFVTARAGVPFLGFFEPFPTLTAMHFLYAGMAVPILAAQVGRVLDARFGRVFAVAACLVMFSSAVIGFGILLSQLIETVAVLALSIGMWLIAGLTLFGVLPRIQSVVLKAMLAIAAIAPFVSMPLALLYSAGELAGATWITIPEMIDSHGRINALGIGLLGALSWLAMRPPPLTRPHPDARVLRDQRALPTNYAHDADESGMTVHVAEATLGHDETGALFARAGDLLLRCAHYPAHAVSIVSDFSLDGRFARPGDRIVVRLHLLHVFGVPVLYRRALVEVTAVEDAERIKRLAYCTTPWHIACGGCGASVVWRDDGMVVFRLRSVERPQWPLLRWPPATRAFRWFLDRALRKAVENMRAHTSSIVAQDGALNG